MSKVNKDKILLEWCKTNPYLTNATLFNFLGENKGQSAIVPIAETVDIEYVDRTKQINYDFMWQASFDISSGTDDFNTDVLFDMRQWIDWIEEKNEAGELPDFGDDYTVLEIQNLSEIPNLAMTYDNSTVKYQFPARLVYLR